MAKKVVRISQAADSRWKGESVASIGPALGAAGVNIPMFCKEFNARTQKDAGEGLIIPTIITVYADRTFSFELRRRHLRPFSCSRRLEFDKGSGEPNKNKVGTLKMVAGRRDRQGKAA